MAKAQTPEIKIDETGVYRYMDDPRSPGGRYYLSGPQSNHDQVDDKGRHYVDEPGQDRRYVSPMSYGGEKPADTTGILKKGPVWDSKKGEWVNPTDWGNIANIGVGTFLTAGMANAAMSGTPMGQVSGVVPGGTTPAAAVPTVSATSPLVAAGSPAVASMPPVGLSTAPTGVSPTASGGGGWLSRLKGLFTGKGTDIAGKIGSAASQYAKGSAENRGAELTAQMDLATLLNSREMDRQQLLANADNDYTNNQVKASTEGRATGVDAWKRLLSAQHALTPSQGPNVSPYSIPVAQPSEATRQGATAMTDEVMKRLTGGNPIAPVTKRDVTLAYDPMSTVNMGLASPGALERVIGTAGTVANAIYDPRRNRQVPTANTSAQKPLYDPYTGQRIE